MNGAIGFDGILTGNISTGGSGTSDYNDLINKPYINNVPLVGNKTTSQLHLFEGNYDDLDDKPSINNVVLTGNKTTADLGLFSGDYDDLTNKPTLFSGDYNDLTNKPTLFSGDYNDLTNKPTLFDGNYQSLINMPQINGVTLIGDKDTSDLGLFSGYYSDLIGKPTLFSGDYDDLTDKPSINGVQLSGNRTTSQLGLFSGNYNDLTNKPTLFSGDYNDLTNKPFIPDLAFDPSDPATETVSDIYLDGDVYEVTDADARAGISLLEDDIAPEYDNTAIYSEGDYCMYAGTIYKANTAIITPEDFDSDHWDATSAGEELIEIKSSLSQLADYSSTEVDTGAKWVDGKTIYKKTISDTTGNSSPSTSTFYLPNNTDTIVNIEFTLSYNTSGGVYCNNTFWSSSDYVVAWVANGNELKFRTTYLTRPFKITVYYTKS